LITIWLFKSLSNKLCKHCDAVLFSIHQFSFFLQFFIEIVSLTAKFKLEQAPSRLLEAHLSAQDDLENVPNQTRIYSTKTEINFIFDH